MLNLFELPHHLKQASQIVTKFDGVEPEQVVIDNRSNDERAFTLEGKKTYTLNLRVDNYLDRPEIISLLTSINVLRPSVHMLTGFGQILFITAGDTEDTVTFVFHMDRKPFKIVQIIILTREKHFESGMLVTDMRIKSNDDNFILASLFDNNKHNTPCKVVKFVRSAESMEWSDKHREKTIQLPDESVDRLCNCFLVERK